MIKSVIGCIAAAICAFLVFLFIVIPFENNRRLRQYEEELKHYDAGAQYRIIETASACGKLYGNGNGMEYLAVMLVACEEELLESALATWEGISIIEADNQGEIQNRLNIHDMNRVSSICETIKELDHSEAYYLLYSLHSAPASSVLSWDLRAH